MSGARIVNLAAIREALARLDEIALRSPELLGTRSTANTLGWEAVLTADEHAVQFARGASIERCEALAGTERSGEHG